MNAIENNKETNTAVADQIPHGNKNYWLDMENRIIAGGNVKKIMSLNNKK